MKEKKISQQEIDIINDGIKHPAVKMVLKKLAEAGEKAILKYDSCVCYEEMVKIQTLRDVCLNEIPRIIENIANADISKQDEKWSFWKWILKNS